MSKTTIPGLGGKNTLRKLLWLAALTVAVVWMVQHPHEVRYGLDQLSTFFTIVSGGDR